MEFDWNIMLTVPMEKWREHGVVLSAASTNPLGIVASFIARRVRCKQKWYGYRFFDKHGVETFHVERC